jgi:hypothetical protein
MDSQDPRSLPELVSSLTTDLADLVRKESQLVRAEVSEKVGQTARAGGEIAIGGVLLIGALVILLQAAVLALSHVMDPVWASLIVAAIVAVAGVLLVKAGMKMMKPASLAPDRSARQLRKDAQLVKGQAQ